MKELLRKDIVYDNQIKLSQQVRIVALSFLATVIPVTLIFISFKLLTKLSLNLLTRDPLVITNAPFYIGMISNIGIILWCAAAAICLFSSAILRKYNRSRKLSKFLLFSGLLTSFLMLDDLFMLHEVVFPEYLNIHEYLVYGTYLTVFFSFFVKNIKVITETEFVILLSAIGFFSLSIVSDMLISELNPFVEDVFKLLGITSWFIYFIRLCLREVSSVIRLSSSSKLV